MDELAERAKLALLDLTDDVIELIIEFHAKGFWGFGEIGRAHV